MINLLHVSKFYLSENPKYRGKTTDVVKSQRFVTSISVLKTENSGRLLGFHIRFDYVVYIYRIKGILFLILSLSGPLSSEPGDAPDRDTSENKQPFILFIGNLHTHIINTLEKRFFCNYRKDFGSKLYLFPFKNFFFGTTFFWHILVCETSFIQAVRA